MGDYYEAPTKESLNRGYFWMTHKKLYRNISLGIMAVVILIIFAVAFVNLYNYFANPSYEQQAVSLTTKKYWLEAHRDNEPKPMSVYETKYIRTGTGLYDLTASVANTNENWAISEVTYHFVVNNVVLSSQTGFLNPGEERIFYQPGYVSNKPISNIKLKIEDVRWRQFESDTMTVDWLIEDIKFKPTSREIDGNQSFTIPPSVTWTATNNSLLDFWEVDFQVALYNGDNLVGVREWKQNYFDSLETKELEVIWLSDLPRVSDVKVHPVLNLLDRSNIREVQADIFRK